MTTSRHLVQQRTALGALIVLALTGSLVGCGGDAEPGEVAPTSVTAPTAPAAEPTAEPTAEETTAEPTAQERDEPEESTDVAQPGTGGTAEPADHSSRAAQPTTEPATDTTKDDPAPYPTDATDVAEQFVRAWVGGDGATVQELAVDEVALATQAWALTGDWQATNVIDFDKHMPAGGLKGYIGVSLNPGGTWPVMDVLVAKDRLGQPDAVVSVDVLGNTAAASPRADHPFATYPLALVEAVQSEDQESFERLATAEVVEAIEQREQFMRPGIDKGRYLLTGIHAAAPVDGRGSELFVFVDFPEDSNDIMAARWLVLDPAVVLQEGDHGVIGAQNGVYEPWT